MSNCLAIFFVLEPVSFGNIVGLVMSFTLLYIFGDFVKGWTGAYYGRNPFEFGPNIIFTSTEF